MHSQKTGCNMKRIAWALLAANLLAAAFFLGQLYLAQSDSDKTLSINAERLSLRSHSSPAPKPLPPKQEAALCVAWRGLTLAEFDLAREQLKAMINEQVMSFTEVPEKTLRWVIFPSLPSEQSANAKLRELEAVGIKDAAVVKEGVWQHAISLGQYDQDEAADKRVRELESRGILGTRIELLPQPDTTFYFVIRSEDRDVLKGLSAIKQAYPNSQQSRVACPS